ncbi:MAG: glutamyl-tRNA reductase, partial [Deltaproteobacteria bacterium]|nr:glutamyl-tRNA reductase [Deltaproteobacteria bacterium]
DARAAILRAWASACGQTATALEPHVYVLNGQEAVRHLFTVASSLDSMVLGEPQSLGQMKDAYRDAVKARTVGILVNRLLHKAFSTAKRVRSETAVAANAVSISYAAVELAKRIFDNMRVCRAMLVGAGEMAELAAAHLTQAGIRQLIVVNRTLSHAEELAQRFHGEAEPLDRLFDRLAEADIVITSTGAHEPLIRPDNLRPVLHTRRNQPMFFIDIAVPRDVDPAINALDNVYLYDIDDLKETVENNIRQRQDEVQKARAIIDEECAGFAAWQDGLKLQPTIVDLIRRHETYAQEELVRTIKRLGDRADAETVDALKAMLASLVRKIDHDPIAFLKAGHHDEDARTQVIDMTRRLFALNEPHDAS